MSDILIVFGSTEGQTEKIMAHIAQHLREEGHVVDLFSTQDIVEPLDLESYDGVIVASSIHVGSHHQGIVDFVDYHQEVLQRRPSAFISVSMTAASEGDEEQDKVRGWVDEFIDQTTWMPDYVAYVAGALRYTEYRFPTRWLLKRIAQEKGLDADTSHDYEYTDWEAVDQFTEQLATFFAHDHS